MGDPNGHGADEPSVAPPGPLIEVSDLSVCFPGGVEALRNVDLAVQPGERVGIGGETGAGKSTLALCLAGLIQPPEAQGSVRVGGEEVMGASPEVLRSVRWARVAVALQGAPLNPVATVGAQIGETLRDRLGISAAAARQRAEELAREALLEVDLLDRFPHQVSGGQRRRALLAMALALDPEVLVLDEPTVGLDAATAKALLEQVTVLAERRRLTLVVISHDLPGVATLVDRFLLLYAGKVVEAGTTPKVLADPAHPYSWALVHAFPLMTTTKDLRPIRGSGPDPRAIPPGCSYHPRCTQAEEICRTAVPPLAPSRGRLVACHFGGLKELLSAVAVRKTFRDHGRQVHALKGVSIRVREGEAVGIVGPSGSGKSTLARILVGQLAPDEGSVVLEGSPIDASWAASARATRRRIQLVAQDPAEALPGRLNVGTLLGEAFAVLPRGQRPTAGEQAEAISDALRSVGLPPAGDFLAAFPHQLSGGQQQRLVLARAMLAGPKVLVADEPTTMLDASEQARLLVLLRDRQVEAGLGLVMVSHDMAVVRKVTDRIIVLDEGEVVEEGPSHILSVSPRSRAARQLVESSPALYVVDPEGADEAPFEDALSQSPKLV